MLAPTDPRFSATSTRGLSRAGCRVPSPPPPSATRSPSPRSGAPSAIPCASPQQHLVGVLVGQPRGGGAALRGRGAAGPRPEARERDGPWCGRTRPRGPSPGSAAPPPRLHPDLRALQRRHLPELGLGQHQAARLLVPGGRLAVSAITVWLWVGWWRRILAVLLAGSVLATGTLALLRLLPYEAPSASVTGPYVVVPAGDMALVATLDTRTSTHAVFLVSGSTNDFFDPIPLLTGRPVVMATTPGCGVMGWTTGSARPMSRSPPQGVAPPRSRSASPSSRFSTATTSATSR